MRGGRRSVLRWLAVLSVIGILAVVLVWRQGGSQPAKAAAPRQATVPVTVTSAAKLDVPILLTAVGTVQASSTVSIHTQVDGKLQSVNFAEGQDVHKGDILAVIDPRPFQAALDQAVGKKGQDEAMLTSAQKDLARFLQLGTKGFETQQNIDQQQAKVDQYKAAITSDQGAIESAQTQLSYTNVTAPTDGKVGFRRIDAGNIVHAGDQEPLTVLTQTHPSTVIFSLPQKNLADVRSAMQRSKVIVRALDQDGVHHLADGELTLIDNQIDQTTSTIRLKATFPNENEALWPGQFVRVTVQVDTRKDATTIPPVAVQRGPQGLYTWVVGSNSTAEQRSLEATTVNDHVAIVTKGLAVGERVVVNGQYRLQSGTRVEAKEKTAETGTNPGEPS